MTAERKFFSEKHRTTVLWAMGFNHIADPRDPIDCIVEKTDWPFVPRVGETVQLQCDEHGLHKGTIKSVDWDDHGQPFVQFR